MESYYDKYLVIWWNKDREEMRVSTLMNYEDAVSMVSAMEKGKLFFYEDEIGNLDDGETYKDWSIIMTKYQPVFEKDLWSEL